MGKKENCERILVHNCKIQLNPAIDDFYSVSLWQFLTSDMKLMTMGLVHDGPKTPWVYRKQDMSPGLTKLKRLADSFFQSKRGIQIRILDVLPHSTSGLLLVKSTKPANQSIFLLHAK